VSAPGRSAGFDGGTVHELVSAASTDGRVAVQEHEGPRGYGHPFHAHTLEDEVLYVLEGVVEVETGDRVSVAAAGSCVALRRHEPHRWRVVSDRARVLITTVPGAFADYFLDPGGGGPWACDELARRGVVLPQSAGNGPFSAPNAPCDGPD
jgi:quercetin dioxygenase-like cupin family protein